MISSAVVFSALELGCVYALVALALFLSFRVLNIADMTTDGSFTLGCAVSATLAVNPHLWVSPGSIQLNSLEKRKRNLS